MSCCFIESTLFSVLVHPDNTIAWIKEQLTNDTPLRAMYQTKKSDMFIMWAEALEEKINNGELEIAVTEISKHINHELKSMDLEGAIFHMYDVLPAKYKKHSVYNEDEIEQSLLGNPNENSSGDEINYSAENATLINISKNLRWSLDTLDELLETSPIESNCDQMYLDEVIKMTNAVSQKTKFCTDGREKLSRLDHVLALELAASCTLNSIYDTLTAIKMRQATITSKQMGKIVQLKIKDAYTTLCPNTEQQAISQGWSGIACDQCGQFRVTREYYSPSQAFMDHCVTCDSWQKMRLSPVLQHRSL